MPIKGTIKAQPLTTVKTMKVGEKGYIDFNTIVVTEDGILLHIDTTVYSEEYVDEDDIDFYIPIERIGSKIHEKSFNLDLRRFEHHVFTLESVETYENCMQFPLSYIVFQRFHLQKLDPSMPALPQTENLEQQLEKAVDSEDYETAAKIRDKLKKKKM